MTRLLLSLLIALSLLVSPVMGEAASPNYMNYDTCVIVYGGSGTCWARATSYFRSLGYTGTLTDMEMQYLGDAGYTGTIYDRWHSYLGDLGYSGTMGDRWRAARVVGTFGIFDLTFYAPFDNPADPLRLIKGTGTLTFTRATTATYVHQTTGLVTTADADALRIESSGALIEGARTNILLRSRTLNNAAWTATNTTADNTITGEDGVANSASWVAASSNGGTICQAVTIASAAYSGAFSLKRITGTGTVKLSLDGGSTYGSDVASSLSTSAWYRASKANQTLANPSLCIQLGTSGDNVAVDYAQVEAGAFASSRIPTTTAAATRNADVLTLPSAGNLLDNAVGTFTFEGDTKDEGGSMVLWTNALGYIAVNLSGSIAAYDGTGWRSGSLWAGNGTSAKLALRWSAADSKMHFVTNGGAVTETDFDGAFTIDETLRIGSSLGESSIFGHLKNYRIWNRAFTDAELQEITN